MEEKEKKITNNSKFCYEWGMRVLKKTAGFFVGLIVGTASTLVFQHDEPEAALSAFPIIHRQGYTLAYDTRAKIPFWTHEHLTKESLAKNVDRTGMAFKEDSDIYLPHRSLLSDYYQSGFDRGHFVPAADVRYEEVALRETFLLTNISPQHPGLNRGLWAKLEKNIRILARESQWVDVTTGPLFLAHEEVDGKRYVTYQVIGKNDVAVPTHFFKVIHTPDRSWAYVLPNEEAQGHLSDYLFSIQELEKLSGIHLTKL